MSDESAVPYTPAAPEMSMYLLTDPERRIVARALQISAVMAEALDHPHEELARLRDRFAPEGLE